MHVLHVLHTHTHTHTQGLRCKALRTVPCAYFDMFHITHARAHDHTIRVAWNCNSMSGLEIDLKGDGRTYIANIKTDGMQQEVSFGFEYSLLRFIHATYLS